MDADISEASGAEDRVGDGMADDVRVGMPVGALVERNRDAAENERTSLNQPMKVIPDADAGGRCGW